MKIDYKWRNEQNGSFDVDCCFRIKQITEEFGISIWDSAFSNSTFGILITTWNISFWKIREKIYDK